MKHRRPHSCAICIHLMNAAHDDALSLDIDAVLNAVFENLQFIPGVEAVEVIEVTDFDLAY